MRSSPSTNAATASVDRCSVEPNCRGPTGASLCEANCEGSQEKARRNACSGSNTSQLLSAQCHVVSTGPTSNVARMRGGDAQTSGRPGRVAETVRGPSIRMACQMITKCLAAAVDAAAHGAQLDAESR